VGDRHIAAAPIAAATASSVAQSPRRLYDGRHVLGDDERIKDGSTLGADYCDRPRRIETHQLDGGPDFWSAIVYDNQTRSML
jgi:hypothetical protein